MPGAIAIMLAFGAEEKAVEPLVLPHRSDAIEASGKHFVDVTLMADVKNKLVLGSLKNAMQSDRQFDDAKVRTEMPAGLGEDPDQLVAYFLGQLREVLLSEGLDVHGGANSIE
jgi:hypothetical protein